MGARDQFRTLLETGDVDGLREAWRQVAPHLPQPETREAAEIAMHRARTESATVSFRARAYSHAWLIERKLPSGLPDALKPAAEQLHPRIVTGVGIMIKSASPMMRPAALEVQKAMSDAVANAYAEGNEEPVFVRARMAEARERTYKALFGGRP